MKWLNLKLTNRKKQAMEQRSEEWRIDRRGKFTSSEMHKLMGVKGLGKTGETYVYDKVAEYMGAEKEEEYVKSTEYGKEMEPYAKDGYVKAFKCEIEDIGFIVSKHTGESGTSPDGLLKGIEKGIEIKCPYNSTNHIKYLTIKTSEDLKKIYPDCYWQIQHAMWCTGFNAWDFISFDYRVKKCPQLYCIEIKPDKEAQELLTDRINQAIKMKYEIIDKILNK